MSLNCKEMIERAIRGDGDALTDLLADVGPVVRRDVASRIPAIWRSLLSEDDVMQQTYADAFRSIARFVPLGDGAFRAWLANLADCNVRDAVKMLEAEKRGGKRRKIDAAPADSSYLNLLDVLSSSGTSPTGQATREEAHEIMERAVRELPETYQTVIRMYDLEGRTAPEVGAVIGRSPGAVYMLRSRAHDRLRDALGSSGRFFTATA